MTVYSDIQFCATGKRGLGHLRRLTNVAIPLRNMTDKSLSLVTNSKIAGLTEDEKSLFSRITVTTRDNFCNQLKNSNHCPVVVDTAVIEDLHTVAAPLILILRETRQEMIKQFRLKNNRNWDLVIVPNPYEHWQVDPEIIATDRVEYVGWIYRHSSLLAPTNVIQPNNTAGYRSSTHKKPVRLLIATGGGGHVRKELTGKLSRIIAALKLNETNPIIVDQAVGPRANVESNIAGVDNNISFCNELHNAFSQYDIVISTGGYNSILELAMTTTPALLMAVDTTYDDQHLRCRQWGKRIGHAYTNESSAVKWLINQIRIRSRRKNTELAQSGSSKAAEHILGLVA